MKLDFGLNKSQIF